MRGLKNRLQKLEHSTNSIEVESKFIYVSYIGDTDEDENIIGIKSKEHYHKREDGESVEELKERIKPMYKGSRSMYVMNYVYKEDIDIDSPKKS